MNAATTIPESSKARRLPPGVRARAARRYRLETVRRLVPMRRAGMAWSACAAALNNEGWFTFTGQPWTTSSLGQLARLTGLAAPRSDRARALAERTSERGPALAVQNRRIVT